MTPGRAEITPAPQTVTASQLASLLPDEQDLQGFVRVRPAFETADWRDAEIHHGTTQGVQPQPLPDGIKLNRDLNEIGPNAQLHGPTDRRGLGSIIRRAMYSTDGVYTLNITLMICDSFNAARREVLDYMSHVQLRFLPGSFAGPLQLGNESWCNGRSGSPGSATMISRYGTIVFIISWGMSYHAARAGDYPLLAPDAMDAVANSILLRLAGEAQLTGVPVRTATVLVNGKQLPSQNALLSGGQVYLPVKEFAKAAGWKSQWNPTTGALALNAPSQPPIQLMADSNAATDTGTV
ncbi:MAG: copper amine oxidase N-terminal domain-containing protein, partial [Armatimonadota bacterium]|nr:copper amine oxidase N-terminal domain-containing protein [Armatimonadota bacterium]